MRKRRKWTEEETNILKSNYANTHMNDLLELLPNHTVRSIMHKCSLLSIRKSSEFMSAFIKKHLVDSRKYRCYHYKLDQNFTIDDLDNETYQVLIGSMLGDGGVYKQSRSKKYLFKEMHGEKQKDYLEWKRTMLSKFSPCNLSGKDPGFSTPSHPIFNQLRNEFYNEEEYRKAFIPLKYIERLDLLGLLIWYLDDGYLCHSPYIYSSLFTRENLENTIAIINKNFDLSIDIMNDNIFSFGKRMNKIRFLIENSVKVMPVWNNLFDKYKIPDCMRYKIRTH